jgi:two-component system LytT family response regulator
MPAAVIVDDERLARRALRALLASHPDVTIVGEAETVEGAAEVIRATDADTVFLDVQLDGESGLDLLPRLDERIAVIFVTAFDRYAVRAFEINALDYLLKPVSPERLAAAVARLCGPSAAAATHSTLLSPNDFLFVRTGSHMRFIKISTIVTVRAEGPGTLVRLWNGSELAVRKAIGEWEGRLPSSTFLRIHRSTLINLEFVERVDDWFHSTYQIHMRGGSAPLQVSRRYAMALRQRLS